MEIKPCNYFVCLIDIMGQKEFFKDIKSPDVGDNIKKDIERVSNGLAEMVRYVSNRYKRLFSNADVGVELFSDSILLSLKEIPGNTSCLSAWLEIIIKVIYIACKYQLPFRGSIVKGLAQRSQSGVIYGNAVDEAIRVEQIVADSFRVVFSNVLAEELSSYSEYEQYCECDIDSVVVLNYAGYKILERNEFLREKRQAPVLLRWVEERFNYFCYKGIEECDKHANPKLARRFKMWREYLIREFSRKGLELHVRN